MEGLIDAFSDIARIEVLGIVVLSAAYGIFVGAIPGLTATMAVALAVPLTYHLDTISAVAAIVTLEACAIFAGDIPTVLLRVPGTPASAAYVDDAYALTRSGRAYEALGTALVLSAAGGLVGAVALFTVSPFVAQIAREFSSLENFWLYLLGLSCAAVVSRGSTIKGTIALLIGLLLATVGLSEVHSQPRLTFGRDELVGGIEFIPAMIGLFGLSEVFRNLWVGTRDAAGEAQGRAERKSIFRAPLALLRRRKRAALRSSVIGTGVGMLPGAGADIAAWLSYATSRRLSKTPDEYGKGSIEGLADATAANNAALAGAWMPALILGIPGDSVTAIVIGVLLMKNITPGASILEKQGQLVWGIYLTFIVANLVLVALGALAVRTAGQIVRVPRRVLVPLILLFCLVGSFALSGNWTDVLVTVAAGLLGFLLESRGVPLGPVVLGLLLGGRVEESFIQSWETYDGSLLAFFGRPWAAVLGVVTLAVWLGPPILGLARRIRRPGGDEAR